MTKKNILIVDDNEDLADGLAMVLEDEGYQVSLAYNGTDAINVFDASHFDIVFVDVKLPDINGMEVYQHINKKDPEARVVMMTGFRIEQVLAEVIEKGDVEILRKPFEMKRVEEILKEVQNESIVLIADDDPDFSEGMSEYLLEQGFKILLAKNGQEALEQMSANNVDVLVLDLRMPVMCGLDVYMELKRKGLAVKTIIVTGHDKEEKGTIDLLRSLNVTGCLFKPFAPDNLLAVIEDILHENK